MACLAMTMEEVVVNKINHENSLAEAEDPSILRKENPIEGAAATCNNSNVHVSEVDPGADLVHQL